MLTVNGQSMTPSRRGPLQSATVTGLTIPPATITVTSANGGSDTEAVVVVLPLRRIHGYLENLNVKQCATKYS